MHDCWLGTVWSNLSPQALPPIFHVCPALPGHTAHQVVRIAAAYLCVYFWKGQ
jgi:hypothetical protein